MKERPIIFNADMVRAILDGRKTQTRRIVKQPICVSHWPGHDPVLELDGKEWCLGDFEQQMCPYGAPGDRLWVREAFRAIEQPSWQYDEIGECEVEYRASPETHLTWANCNPPWKPSIHMPRWASRITLEVTNVRVERLQDISEWDAQAEGCDGPAPMSVDPHDLDARERFQGLWRSIYGPDSWGANPWVWVVEFRRAEP